jgi:hypothetical protein
VRSARGTRVVGIRGPRTIAKRARPEGRGSVLAGAAAAYSQGVRQAEPKITRGKDWVRISHKELVTNITGTTTYTVLNTFPLNPGMTTFLKWLPTQAVGWETYQWHSIVAESLTRCGTGTAGSIQLCPDYDASDPAPTDEFSESSYKDLCEDAPWKTIRCVMPGSRLHPNGVKKFIRFGAVPNTDVKTYDAGNLFVSTTDGASVASWSKLWIHYDVTLFTPQLPPGGVVALSNVLHIQGATPTTANAFPNGTAQVYLPGSNVGIATVPITGEIITFNAAGNYMVVYATDTTTNTVTGSPTVGGPAGSALSATWYAPTGDFGTAALGQAVAGSAAAKTVLVTVLTAVAGTTLTYNNTIVGGLFYDLTIVGLASLAQ